MGNSRNIGVNSMACGSLNKLRLCRTLHLTGAAGDFPCRYAGTGCRYVGWDRRYVVSPCALRAGGEWYARKPGWPEAACLGQDPLGIDQETLEARAVEVTRSHIPQLIQDREVEPGDQICGSALARSAGLGVQFVHKVDDVEEPPPTPGPDGSAGGVVGERGFAGSGALETHSSPGRAQR